jgi:transcriptional regulator with XRE-family HTH domain
LVQLGLLRADDDMEMRRVAKSNQDLPVSPASRLGRRLRALREEAPVRLTQRQLAGVLGGSASMISMEENGERLPSSARLARYAHLFCTPRSFSDEGLRLLADAELMEEEVELLQRLEVELLGLRKAASADETLEPSESDEPGRVWRFTDGASITIVLADVPKNQRPEYSNPQDLNYVRAASFADLDALLDLFGHLRAENPATTVRIRATGELTREEMGGHLVLLGGVTRNPYTKQMYAQIRLPVRQLPPERGDVFVTNTDAEPEEFGAKLDDKGVLVEDVGLFARAPNPMDPAGTLTICGGVTTRGVRGAVLCFADPTLRDLREQNQRFIAERFAGHSSYGFLVKVEVLPSGNGEPSTPDLTKDETRLLEWPDGRAEAT